jgi:uncharacterized repeat protein (TIGR03803 family)
MVTDHMRRSRVLARIIAHGLGAVIAACLASGAGAAPYGETVLYSFCKQTNCTDGGDPHYAGVTRDASSGTLYGTTQLGGAHGAGTVFALAPGAAGWTQTVLYSFCEQTINCDDGASPEAGVILDASSGKLYGTTLNSGTGGYGTVFELAPNASKQWTETVLYSFTGLSDGASPQAGVTRDASSGKLYGTTQYGGAHGYGAVFELTPTRPDGRRPSSTASPAFPTARTPPRACSGTRRGNSMAPPTAAARTAPEQCSCSPRTRPSGRRRSSTAFARGGAAAMANTRLPG